MKREFVDIFSRTLTNSHVTTSHKMQPLWHDSYPQLIMLQERKVSSDWTTCVYQSNCARVSEH